MTPLLLAHSYANSFFLTRTKYALARLTARSNASPRLVALLPQRKVMDDDGGVMYPDGIPVFLFDFTSTIALLVS